MGGQITLSSTIMADQAGVIAADAAGFTSMKSYANLLTAIAGAPLASPTFTGTPAAPTASPGTNTTQIATTAFVTAAVSGGTYLALSGGSLTGDLTIGSKVVPALILDSTGTTDNEGPILRFRKSGANKWAWFMPASSLNCELFNNVTSSNALSVNPSNNVTFGGTVTVAATVTVGATATPALNLNSSGTTSVQGAILRLQKNGTSKWGLWSPADTDSCGIYNYATSSFAIDITAAGSVTMSGTVSVGTYTVATLPAAGSNAYKMANVSDSNAAASGNYGATVAGGGSNKVRVFSDGTNWVIA